MARRSASRSLLEIVVTLVVVVLLAFVLQTFVARPYVIPSESMEPTLHGCPGCTNDRIIAEKLTYYVREPRIGDVVVFRGPPSWNEGYQSIRSDNAVRRALENAAATVGLAPPDENNLVKRVVATGGQTVACCDVQGRVTVDGLALDEPYVVHDFPWNPGGENASYPVGRAFGPITVPDGHLWMMGDNRSNSKDSRFYVGDETNGTVSVDDVRGRAVAVFWPINRAGPID
ncbi:signal peptidase I [Rhodococcus rhodnii]|uniref:Signal peptidase I n=2 Tax=Rhodococcus rhodnii TaxID=38312 RepID=R7WP67_9NOCA|nr:signal peptidase I [Rhodococcus rhodnii]EOM75769.1 signal peptidase I [Rhodococcus rhodnii LMG 5362]TXG91484.1 signal peptidase I [Rhodococcus rhodnii]